MPMMKSHHSHVLNTLKGHCIPVEANVPIWIPPEIVGEAISAAMQECDEQPANEVAVVAPPETSDNSAEDEDVWSVALDQAILRVLTRNDPSDYKADLTPKVVKIVAEMSPDLRRPTATEVSDAFLRLQENIDLAE